MSQPEPNPHARTDRLVLLALLGAVVLFLFPYLVLGRAMLPLELLAVFQPWASHREAFGADVPPAHNPLLDALQQYYPRRVYMTEALRGGWLPLWNPYVYGGSPFLAAQQGAVLYPPAWLLALLPPALQFGWSALLHLYAAAAGTYLFLRRLELRPGAAATGAVAFAFNGFLVVWLAYPNVTQWTLCWLPLALYAWERGRSRDDLRWLAASGGVLALSLLGGHAQSSAYGLLVWGGWALLRWWQAGPRVSRLGRWLALPAALAVALSLGHLLPALEFVPRTDRAARLSWEAVTRAGMPPAQLLNLFLPRLFGDGTLDFAQQFWLPAGGKAALTFVERTFYPGVAVLILAGAGFLALGSIRSTAPEERGKGLLAWFGLGITLLGLLWAMGTELYRPLWLLPGFGQFTAVARIVCIAGWGLACLAALGVQSLTGPEAAVRARAFSALGVAGGLCAAVILGAHFVYGGVDPLQIGPALASSGARSLDDLAATALVLALLWVAGTLLLGWLARAGRFSRPGAAGLGFALVVAADLFAFGYPFNPRANPGLLAAKTPELAELARRTGPQRFMSPRPADAARDLNQRMPSNLPSTFGAADLLGSDSFVPLRYREWETATQAASGGATSQAWARGPNARSAAVRLYLAGPRQQLGFPRPIAGTTLFEDPEALPYARVHLNAQSPGSRADLLQALAHPRRENRIVLTEGVTYNGPARVIPFQVRRRNGNRLVIEGETPLPGLLVVAEAYDPGWRASIDGRPVRPVPADHLLTGIPLEAGTHRVELTYAPASLRVGLFASLAALALLAGLVIAGRAPE